MLEWTYVLLIYTDDEYGVEGAAAVKEYGENIGICFSQSIQVSLHPEDRSKYFENLAKNITESPAVGVIFFGQESAGKYMLESYINKVKGTLAAPKVFLLSDGLGTSSSVLERLAGDLDGKTSIIAVSPYNDPSDLDTYIADRLSGKLSGSPDTERLVARFKSDCQTSGRSDFCLSALKAGDFTMHTIEALVAFLSAFKMSHTKLCGESTSGVCEALSNSPLFYHTMLKSLKSSNTTATVGNSEVNIAFDSNGEVDRGSAAPAYKLSAAVKINQKWEYQEAGTYSYNSSWTYSNKAILPTGLTSRCQTNCDACIKPSTPYLYRKGTSRYIIAGTASISDGEDQHGCGETITLNGFVMMESFYYAVEQIKSLTNIDFSTLFIDTCYATLGTHNVLNGIFSSEDTAFLIGPDGKPHEVRPNDFIVFIGDSSSGISLVLQTYLSLYNIPQISFRSTSTWLSDTLRYPLFLRNVPSDKEQARLMIEIVTKNKWDSIALLYSNTVYGQTGGELIVQYAKEAGICISFIKKAGNTDEEIKDLAFEIKDAREENKLPRVVVIFADDSYFKKLLENLEKYDPTWSQRGHIFIGSETWSNSEDVIKGSEEFAYGSLTFSLSQNTFSWTNKNGVNDFQRYLRDQKPQHNTDNRLFIKFWQQYFMCFLPREAVSSGTRKCDPDQENLADTETVTNRLDYEAVVGKHVVMAVLSVAYAIQEAISSERICTQTGSGVDCSNLFEAKRQRFFELLQSTNIPTEVGSFKKTYQPYLANGDGRVNYQVYNIQKQGKKAIYSIAYTISDGEITEARRPVFYSGGRVDSSFNSDCPGCLCMRETSHGLATTDIPTTSKPQPVEWDPPSYLLPILVLLTISVVVLLVIAAVYVMLLKRKAQRKEDMSMDTYSGINYTNDRPPALPSTRLPSLQPGLANGSSISNSYRTGVTVGVGEQNLAYNHSDSGVVPGDGRQSGYEWPEPVSLVSGSRRPSQQPQAARRNSNRSTPIQTPTHYSDTLIDGSTNSSLSLGIAPQPSERNLGASARRPTPTASYDPGTKPQPLTEKPQHSEDEDPRYMEEQKHFPYENN